MRAKKVRKKQRLDTWDQAANELLREKPEIREKLEQLRQARSRTLGREVSFNEMFNYVGGVGAKHWLEELEAAELAEKLRGQMLVYFVESRCPSDHPVMMILGEYDDPAKAWEGLSKLMAERGPKQCPRCQSSEFHIKFCHTRFHSRAELETWKALRDVRN